MSDADDKKAAKLAKLAEMEKLREEKMARMARVKSRLNNKQVTSAGDAADWQSLQIKIFLRWVNQRLAVRSLKVTNGIKGFANGFELLNLMEILSETHYKGKKMKPECKGKMQQIDQCNGTLKFIAKCGIEMKVKTSAENLVDGEVLPVLGLLWAIMQSFLKFSDDDDGPVLSVRDSLIMWFANQLVDYPDINVHDLTKCFHDGKIICAITHKYRPKLVDMAKLESQDGAANLQMGLDAATEFFGLEQYLTPHDITKLDEKSMIVFLSEFFYGVAAQRKIDLAARRIGKVIKFTEENDKMRATYETNSQRLFDLVAKLEEKMADRTIDNTMAGAKQRLDGFYKYKTEEKGETVDSDYLSLETCANLLDMRLAQHERPVFVQPEGRTLADFRKSLKHLEESEGQMKKHLHTEHNRQLKVANLNEQHTTRFNNLQAWGAEKRTYLCLKEEILSVGAAEFQLQQLESFKVEAQGLSDSNIADLTKRGDVLREEKYENADAVSKRESDIASLMTELDGLRTTKLAVAEDDLTREKFKEQVRGWNTKHVTVFDGIQKWTNEKKAYLAVKEEVGSIADAELHLSLLKAFMKERTDLEAAKVPPFCELGKQVLEAEFKSEHSEWKFEHPDKVQEREATVQASFPELDALSATKLAILEDDLAREKFREQLRQDNVAHTNMYSALNQWIEAKRTYLAVKEECDSIADAVSNLSTIASYHREKTNQSNGAVPTLKTLGNSIITRRYETSLSKYAFPTPDEVTDRETKVDEAWVELDASSATKQAILDDDLAREKFREQLRQDNEQHKNKFAKLEAWIAAKTAYLQKRDDVDSVTQAQENLSTLAAYSAEKVDTTNGDVAAFTKLGAHIKSARYETELSKYEFTTPEEITTREDSVAASWTSLDGLHATKLALAQDDLAREEFREDLRQRNEQHKLKHTSLMTWVGEKKAYLEVKEEVASVPEAQQNLATWTAYEEEKSITLTGAISGLKASGQAIRDAKYETELSNYAFPTPEQITAREGEIDDSITMLDGLSKTKEAILLDDLAREEFKAKLRAMNVQHINDHTTLKAWVADKTAYLNKKEAVASISDAQQNLAAWNAYETEKTYTTNGAVASMKQLGQDILDDKYKTALSSWEWETPEELAARESELDDDWRVLDDLSVTKKAILDDDLAREEFKERLRLDNENHKSKHAWLCGYHGSGLEALAKKEECDSITDARNNLASLDAFDADQSATDGFNFTSLKSLGASITEAKYATDLSSYVFENPAEILEREGDIATKFSELTAKSVEKRAVLDADLARELKKEELRLSFADAAAAFERWVKDRQDDAATTHFGFTLAEVQAFKAALDGMDVTVTETGSTKATAAKTIHTEAVELGVTANVYTTHDPASLDEVTQTLGKALEGRQTGYSTELARQIENDQLCQKFASMATPFVEAIDKTKESLSGEAAGELEAQAETVNAKLAQDDAEVKAMEALQTTMDAAGISFNIHTLLTATDGRLIWNSYQSFLTVKKKNLDEEIELKRLRGVSPEQYAELEKMFAQFDKSKNGLLDKQEFKACLYSLGDERGSKEVSQIMAQYSSGDGGINYDGFREFMIIQLGDTDTKDEILYAFALINGDISPSQKKLDQLNEEEKEALTAQLDAIPKVAKDAPMLKVMEEEEVAYIKGTHGADGGVQYDTWTESVFAR